MHYSGLEIVLVYALLGQALARLPPLTLSPEHNHAELEPGNLDLRRRGTGQDMPSGTLTITIAPDETCGYDNHGDPIVTCSSGRHCSWESGRLNLAFCGWQSLFTSCVDYADSTDTAYCDDACQSNTNLGFCTGTVYPYCMQAQLGDDITTWRCGSEYTTLSYDTTQSLEDRTFKTMIVVDGSPVTTFISSMTTSKPTTTTIKKNSVTTTTTSTSTSPVTHGGGTNVGAIVGGVVGGVAAIALAVLGVLGFLYLRRRRNNSANDAPPPPNDESNFQVQQQTNSGNTPNVFTPTTEIEDGTIMNSPIKYQAQAFSPTLSTSTNPTFSTAYSPPPFQQSPSPRGPEMYELDGDKINHHHGSMQELH